MSRLGPFLASGILTLGIGFAGFAAAPRPSTGTDLASAWIMNYEQGKAASLRSKKPIMLVIR